MEKELISSKEFYILSYDIFKTLSIERQYRMLDGKIYLDNIHTKYCNLIEQGNLLDKEKLEMMSIDFSKEMKKRMDKLQENIQTDLIENVEMGSSQLTQKLNNQTDKLIENVEMGSSQLTQKLNNQTDKLQINITDNLVPMQMEYQKVMPIDIESEPENTETTENL
jgi:hypothetical protein